MSNPPNTEYFDVVIVGCGISGIGAGAHLRQLSPNRSFVILEGRSELGGTWSLFKYPGIRTDSDMFTMGYDFKPWREDNAIARGDRIINYLKETVSEYKLGPHIRYSHKVEAIDWSTGSSSWTVTTDQPGVHISCNAVIYGGGYYSYEDAYSPTFEGQDSFTGRIVHPQFWPEDLDYSGKRVVIIGSGATAITILPSMTDAAAHVTMLQRSPSYIVAAPQEGFLQKATKNVLPDNMRYKLIRASKILLFQVVYNYMKAYPDASRKFLIKGVKNTLGDKHFEARHFSPAYKPWDQRVCLAPDGDFFKAIRRGKASIVTDHIDRFTKSGILLKSGQELEADLIITATGLNARFNPTCDIRVDGRIIVPHEHMMYKGCLVSGVPNLAILTGYTNASWTLKVDLTCRFMCRLLNQMARTGATQFCAVPDETVQAEPLITNLTSNYILRSLEQMPKQGDRHPWKLHQNYMRDMMMYSWGSLEDGTLRLSGALSPIAAKL